MSENIEFIPAKDLPEATSNEVSVVCLENGELKQKPGASLGGGEKTDLVLELISPVLFGEATEANTTVNIKTGSLDSVVEALEAGRAPVVKVEHFDDSNDSPDFRIREGGVYDCSVLRYAEFLYFMFALPKQAMMQISLSIDDPTYCEIYLCPIPMTQIQIV